MAVSEDAATPSPQTPVAASSGVATSNSFTPPAGTYVLVVVSWLFTNNATATLSCKDSAGTSYTNLAQVQDNTKATINALFGLYYASSPGSITAKVTCTNTGSAGAVLAPRVLDGAASVQTGAGVLTATGSSATWTGSLTTTQTGSLVYVVAGSTSTVTLTGGANTSLIAAVSSGQYGDSGALGRASSNTSTPGATTFGFSSSGSESFGIAGIEILPTASAGPAVGATDRDSIDPSPAWQNQFGPISHSSKNAVLYDTQLTFSASYVTAGDLAFSATSHGVQTIIVSDPQGILPGPAWANMFGPASAARLRPVLFDRGLVFNSGIYNNPGGDLAFGAKSVGNAAPANSDRPVASPGLPFLNTFQQNQLLKYAIQFDVYPQFGSTPSANITFGATSIGLQTIAGLVSPVVAQPGPAWLNRFQGALLKQITPFQINFIPPPFGPFCFSGTETDANAGMGGTFTDTNLYGGSQTDTNLYGGTVTFGCPPVNLNLTLGEFNDETIDLTITNNGSPFNLTAYSLQALFKTSAGTPDGNATVFSTVNGGIVITSSTAGTAVLTIPHADIQSNSWGFWRVDVMISNSQATAIYGNVTIISL